mgnify:FL=1|jgi:ATP-binding cassette subfamily B multidrug efflux pump
MAGHRHGPGRIPEKPKNFKGTLRKLLRCLGAYRFALALVLVLALASTAFGIVGPKILSTATTELATGLGRKLSGLGGIDFGKIGKILLTVLALYLVSAACSFFQSWILAGITQRLAYRLRGEISSKIHRMPMRYFERNTVGDVLSRITNDVDTMSSGMAQSVTQLVTNVTLLIGVLVMMLRISWLMTLIALIMLPVTGVLTSRIVKRSQRYFVAQQKNLGDINGKVEETYAGHNVVCAFNREGATQKEFDAINARLYRSAWKSQFLSGLMSPVTTFVSKLGYVCVVVLGGSLAAHGTITIGDIQAFISYMSSFTQPITQLAQISTQLQTMAAAAERVFAFLAEPEEPADPALPAPADHIRGDVSFRHVRFGYDPEQPVIHDWSCDVPAGRTVAIVGPTGAGKTTMVKLLMRFYDVDAGAILVDGRDVRDYARGDLRRAFGMVLQDTWLFKGTIMENIRYGRPEATDAEVIAAAKAARADAFIRTLPGGYQMELNEEATNVSQGQKQLLTIARAVLANAPILILDEATSSVDTRTEQLIQEAMDHLMRGRTSFVIAHRLSTIRNADCILVMRGGSIVEQGTHSELLARGGFYAALYNSQFEDVVA